MKVTAALGAGGLVTPQRRWFYALAPQVGTFTTIEDRAYFVYVGMTTETIRAQHVEAHLRTAGAGAQTAEFGIGYSPFPPNKANQRIYKIAASGTVTSLTGTGNVRNTVGFNMVIGKGVHLWAMMRTAMASTEPTFMGVAQEFNAGSVLAFSSAGALTAGFSWLGVVAASASPPTPVAPYMQIVCD